MPYPNGADLAAWMVAQKLLTEVPEDLAAQDGAIAAAASAFEADVGWGPFLAGPSETRLLDGPGGFRLDLPTAALSVTAVAIGGAPLVPNVDFFLENPVPGGPYRTLSFAGFVPRFRRLVSVTGTFGYCLSVPADVRLALLSHAAAGFSTDTMESGAVKTMKAGPVEYDYEVSAGARLKPAQMLALYAAAVDRYRRIA